MKRVGRVDVLVMTTVCVVFGKPLTTMRRTLSGSVTASSAVTATAAAPSMEYVNPSLSFVTLIVTTVPASVEV
ncbi:hypothetical protein D3C73_1580820 [compost metagenome]